MTSSYHNIVAYQYTDTALYIDIYSAPAAKETVLFLHGFKGFKDWGAWGTMAKKFLQNGINFVNINLSYNGFNPLQNNEFDPDLFAKNTFTQEIRDVERTINFLIQEGKNYGIEQDKFSLIGHSRGGGIAIVVAARDLRINKLVTWASISQFESLFAQINKEEWEARGVASVYNSRLNIDMPINYEIWKDLAKNKSEYNILLQAQEIIVPFLIIHGKEDEVVSMSAAQELYQSCVHAIKLEVENCNHVFGLSHPFESGKLFTKEFQEVLDNTIDFLLEEDSSE